MNERSRNQKVLAVLNNERIKNKTEASYLRAPRSFIPDVAFGIPVKTSPKNIIQEDEDQVWKAPALPNYPKPEFHPYYLPGSDNKSMAINAVTEIRALWAYVEKEAYYNYSEMYSQLLIPMTKTVTETCKKHKETFAVYDKKTKKWLIESSEPSYKYCYNGKDFEEFQEAKAKTIGSRLLLVGKYTTLMQEPNLIRETKTALASYCGFQMPVMKLIVGVPGCGKTSYIINNHGAGSLVLTSCTEGAEDIRSRMGKLRNRESSTFRDLYRTIDSYLLHSRRYVGEVWMDEALMEHPGKLFLVCLFSGCRVMNLLGDPNQLGYINRVKEIDLSYDKSSKFFKPAHTLNTSYRCPVDVMTVLSSKYEGGTHSTSTVLRSMESQTYTSLEHVPKVKGTKYLVFRQAEKKTMRTAGYDVSTIHEFQGKEAEHVIIVRTCRSLRAWPYDSFAHVLVGMTRHRETLVYYTPVADYLKRLIMTRLTDEELRKHQKLSPPVESNRRVARPYYINDVATLNRNLSLLTIKQKQSTITNTIAHGMVYTIPCTPRATPDTPILSRIWTWVKNLF